MHFNQLKTLLFLTALLSLYCILNLAHAESLDTKISRDTVALGESLTVSFTLTNASTRVSPDFSAFEKDFRVLGTNYGTTFTMLNGATTTQSIWRLTVTPKTAGELTLPEIPFGQAKSAPLKIVVNKTAEVMPGDAKDATVFVKAELSTTSPYIQSQVLYTFKLFYRTQLENLRIEAPKIRDATVALMGDGRNYQTTVKGKPFFVFEKTLAIFPQKSGKLSIPPTYLRGITFDMNPNMYDPFYVIPSRPISLATQPFTLDVRKIPDAFQKSTWLPARNIALTETWSVSPDQWEAGTPVTRTINLEAQGLRADQIPDLTIAKITGVNIYVDPPRRSNSTRDNSIVGTMQQKVTYIPTSSQSFTLPALTLSWWNTQTNTNAVSQLNAVKVQVKGKTISAGPAPSTGADMQKPLQESPMQAPVTTNPGYPFYSSIWFWIAISLLVIWMLTLGFIWNKRTARISAPVDPLPAPAKELRDTHLAQACEQGNAILAQQFLLSWAKEQWQETPLNLEKLREMSSDENFKAALANLEQALYAKKAMPWDGRALFDAYKRVKKHRKHPVSSSAKNRRADPLPPLNP